MLDAHSAGSFSFLSAWRELFSPEYPGERHERQELDDHERRRAVNVEREVIETFLQWRCDW